MEEDLGDGYDLLLSFAVLTSTTDTFLGELLLRSLLKALLMKEKHASENKKFDDTFTEDLREDWLMMIRNWECDKSSPNPYTHTEKGMLILVFQFLAHSHSPS